MGLFDFLNKKKAADFGTWHAETDMDKFAGIGQSDVESYLSRIQDRIYEFVIFTLPDPVQGCNMACVSLGSSGLRLELSIRDEDSGRFKILDKTDLSSDDVMDVLINMAGKKKLPDTSDYSNVGSYADPKMKWFEKKLTE